MLILQLRNHDTYASVVSMNRQSTRNAIRRSRRITASFGMVSVVA